MTDRPKFRSQNVTGRTDRDGFIHRSWMNGEGLPVIGMCNTWSELTPCNTHLRELTDHMKRAWRWGESTALRGRINAAIIGFSRRRTGTNYNKAIRLTIRGK